MPSCHYWFRVGESFYFLQKQCFSSGNKKRSEKRGELFRGVQEGKEDWGNMGQGVQAGSENMERECVT